MAAPDDVAIPESHVDLLARPIPAILTTLMPDGRPQSSVVWASYRDSVLTLNTELGRRKTTNMEADPRVTLLVVDPDDQHRYLELRCNVASVSTDGALEHRAALDVDHLGPDHHTDPSDDRNARVVIELRPVRVHAYG